jgi:hypothetical protein
MVKTLEYRKTQFILNAKARHGDLYTCDKISNSKSENTFYNILRNILYILVLRKNIKIYIYMLNYNLIFF